MRLETILDAMQFANDRYVHNPEMTLRRGRQYRAFRYRILRMDEEKDVAIAIHKILQSARELVIAEKDTKIDKLMDLAVVVDRLRKQRMNTDYLDAMEIAKAILQERS